MIEATNLNFFYGKKQILHDINFKFDGGILNILGPNGSGKSTLLRCLLSLCKFSGEIRLNGHEVTSYDKKELAKLCAYIPQSSFMSFNYSVIDVVLMGRLAHKRIFENFSASDYEICKNALTLMQIEKLEEKSFLQISGGEKQLALIARAIAQGSKILYMDEPTNGLDFGNQIRLLEMILNLSHDGYNFIITTHHPRQAKFLGHEIFLIKSGREFLKGSCDKLDISTISNLYDINYKPYKDKL